MTKSASFDVIGTCFAFDSAIAAIASSIGPQLSKAGMEPKGLFFSWFYAAQRDFTYVSMVGDYKPIAQILKHTFKRACRTVGVPADQVNDEDVALVMDAFTKMEARPDLKRCVDGLREKGWDVYAVTNGGVQTTLGYYQQADIDIDATHVLSCDDLRVAKPDLKVYQNACTYLDAQRAGSAADEERWFVAAHAWDLHAAKRAGFKTAYLDFEEHDSATDIFGTFDVYANGMNELLKKLVSM